MLKTHYPANLLPCFFFTKPENKTINWQEKRYHCEEKKGNLFIERDETKPAAAHWICFCPKPFQQKKAVEPRTEM